MYRKISAIIIPTVIAFGIIAAMLIRVWGDLLEALRHIVPVYLAAGVVICLAAWWIRGWRYRFILGGLGYRVSIAVSAACIFVSQTVNLIIPARLGDFVRVFILRHDYATTYSEGVSSLVVERVFDIVTVAALGAVALLFVLDVPSEYYLIIAIPLLAGVIFLALVSQLGRRTTDNRYIKILLTMLHEIERACLSPRAVLALGSSSIVIWILDILVCYSVVMMFNQVIPFPVVVLAIVVGNLVKAVPITPGGIGTYEISLAVIFGLAGVSPAVSTLIAIIDHLIKNVITLAGGIVSVYFFGDWVIPSIRSALDFKNGGKDPDT